MARMNTRSRRRAMIWSLVAMLAVAMTAPLGGYVYVGLTDAHAQWQQEGSNPRSDYWRGARQGVEGYTTVQGQETNVLIQNGGENWRALRNGPVASYTPWIMAVALGAIALFHVIVGRNRLDEARSGETVPRWALWERVLHWTTATLFIILGITGLSLLFGRAVLIPLLGPEGFAAYAVFSKNLHNYAGPFFSVCVLAMIVSWVWYNIPNRTDLQWLKNGGVFGKGHHPAGRFNAGEKIWFWFITLAGGAVIVTGLILDFPNFGQTRETMQISNLIHGVGAMLWISLFFGHAYIGTLGTEGALEGMTTGRVSSEWAKQHHDEWYREVKEREARKPAGGRAGATQG